MSEMKKKRRLRSVILISAIGAVACGGRAEDNGRDSEQTGGDGDGDGDEYVIGDPIGLPPDPGSGGYFIGAPPVATGGGFIGGTGGSFIPGTGGVPIGEPPPLGGMGGSTDESVGEVVGTPR